MASFYNENSIHNPLVNPRDKYNDKKRNKISETNYNYPEKINPSEETKESEKQNKEHNPNVSGKYLDISV